MTLVAGTSEIIKFVVLFGGKIKQKILKQLGKLSEC